MPKTKEKVRPEKLPVVFPIQLFDEGDAKVPERIHILPTGAWEHPVYGKIVITASDIAEFKANFDRGLRKGVPITEGHEIMDEKPAVGWFMELEDAVEQGLYAYVDWTKQGKDLLSSKSYKYFSPEFYREYEDPQTREIYRNVLVGGALTNKPYFKELEAIVFSEANIKNQLTYNETMPEEIKAILEKNSSEWTDDEKALVRANAGHLTDEQKEEHKAILEESDAGSDDDKGDDDSDKGGEDTGSDDGADDAETDGDDDKGGEDTDGAGSSDDEGGEADDTDAGGENTDEGSDNTGDKKEFTEDGKVKVSASYLKALETNANQGKEAFNELQKMRLDTAVKELTFSERNPKGRFLPKTETKLRKFMETLNAEQHSAFSELVKSIPASFNFDELGDDNAAETSAKREVETKVAAKMSEDKALKYSDALKQVFAEDENLAKRYNLETSEA